MPNPVKDAKRPRPGSDAEVGVVEELADVKKELVELRIDIKKMLEKMGAMEQLNAAVRKMNERLDSQEKRVCEMEVKIVKQEKVMKNNKERIDRLEARAVDQEARSRRNNLLFFNVAEEEKEDCIRKVLDFGRIICPNKDAMSLMVERSHRLGKKRANAKPRPIIAKFVNFQDKMEFLKGKRLLPTTISVAEDFPLEVREARKTLLPRLHQAKEEGRRAWIAYPARLIVEGEEVTRVDPTTCQA